MSDAEVLENLREQFDELASTITDNKQWFEVWQADAETAIEDVAGAMGDATGAAEAFVQSFDVSDPAERLEILRDAAEDSQKEIDKLEKKAKEAIATSDGLAASTAGLTEVESERLDTLRDANEVIDKAFKKQEAEIEITKALADAKGLSVEAYKEYVEQLEATEAAQESWEDSLVDSADAVDLYNEAVKDKGKKAINSVQAFLDEQAKRIRQSQAFENNLRRMADKGFDEGLIDTIRAKGPAVGGATAGALAKATSREVQQANRNNAKLLGGQLTDGMAGSIDNTSGRVSGAVRRSVRVAEREANIKARIDTSSFNSDVQNSIWRIPTQIVRAKMEMILNP